jgi:hypothetical protein
MRLSRDSTIDTLLIVAGLLLGLRGFISVVEKTAVAFLFTESSGLSAELLRALQCFPGIPLIQLVVAAVMVVRPNFIRTSFLFAHSDSARFFSSKSHGFWLCCVQTVGFCVVIHSAVSSLSVIFRSYYFRLRFWGANESAFELEHSFGWFSVPLGMLAVSAPAWVLAMLRLESSGTPVTDAPDLGDLHLRRSGILVACWLILFEVLVYFGGRAAWLLENTDGELWREASIVAAVIVTVAGLAVWMARGWLADLFAERVGSICMACGCRSVDVSSSCPECDGVTVGFVRPIESPDVDWGRNWLALLAASMVVVAVPESVRAIQYWYRSMTYSVPPLLSSGWFPVLSVVVAVQWSLVVVLRSYAVRLLPRPTSYSETFFRLGGVMMLFSGIEGALGSAAMVNSYQGPMLGWQTGVLTAVARLVAGLFCLYCPAAWLPGRGTDESPVVHSSSVDEKAGPPKV